MLRRILLLVFGGRWRRGSIAVRVTLAATLVSALGLFILLAGLHLVVDRQARAAVMASLTAQSQELERALHDEGLSALSTEPYAELKVGRVQTSSPTMKRAGGHLIIDAQPTGARSLFTTQQLSLSGETGLVPMRVLTRTLPDGEVLAVGELIASQQETSENRLVGLLVTGPLLLLLITITVGRSIHAALKPVDRLTREAALISVTEDSTRRLHTVPGHDEIARLAQTLDDMLHRLTVAFQHERAFVDDASHELRTPVAVIRGELELALSDLQDHAGVETSLRAAFAETERLQRLCEDLLVLARERAGTLTLRSEALDVTDFLVAFVRRLSTTLSLHVTIDSDPGGVEWRGDGLRLEQILANLVVNAQAAGSSHVRLQARGRSDNAGITLSVEDDGPGFPPGFLDRAFERFTRADAARTRQGGAGLGLALVSALTHALGGSVSASNDSALGGASVRLSLPSISNSSHPESF